MLQSVFFKAYTVFLRTLIFSCWKCLSGTEVLVLPWREKVDSSMLGCSLTFIPKLTSIDENFGAGNICIATLADAKILLKLCGLESISESIPPYMF